MRKVKQTIAVVALTAMIGGGTLLPIQPANAATAVPYATVSQAASAYFNQQVDKAIQQLVDKKVLVGYQDGSIRAEQNITNAEFLKMAILTLHVEQANNASTQPAKWYTPFIETAVNASLIEKADDIVPNELADKTATAQLVAKALQRDVKSVLYWMDGLGIDGSTLNRGQAAQLLVLAEKSVRSADAQIVSIRSINKVSLEVTFSAPLALADEATDAANANFAFSDELKLVNQPRLKTGSIATYIVPVQTMTPGKTYTTNYKGKQQHSVVASNEKLQLSDVRQVTADTFEVESFRADGVIDYGYMISAYSGGRGANAAILDENNKLNGKQMQVIPSLASRQATLTPAGGDPITVNYVGYTQSTDGKQEPKFRLPAGTTLQAGVEYTVSADWFDLEDNTFTAQTIAPLTIAAVDKVNETTLNVTLSVDPGDELFAYRSIQLKGSDGTTLTAQYKVQTRSGATGVFELQQEGKLVDGVSYEVAPVGSWAVVDKVTLAAK
ncbi:S-layer homology domain-containing protein [Paenibacillus yanchengensis]|uniref:S-layer homology domain-containing protein n=1 Tax=Paenibacillus yanchengensis TaxID=2035833 RepID=A0ABW4YHN9_9BACL